MHLGLDSTIVLAKVLFDLGLQFLQVLLLLVDSSVYINTFHKVTEDNALRVEKFLLWHLELGLDLVDHNAGQELAISVVNETVTNDTGVLVVPKSKELARGLGQL